MKGVLLLENRAKKERSITLPFWCILRSRLPQNLITSALSTVVPRRTEPRGTTPLWKVPEAADQILEDTRSLAATWM